MPVVMRILSVTALIVLMSSCTAATGEATTRVETFRNGLIAVDRGVDIYVVRPDGSESRNVTQGQASRSAMPQWSPNGNKLLFGCYLEDRSQEICLINADGTGFHRLTDNNFTDFSPDWSPDGNRIVFVRSYSSGTKLVVQNLQSNNEHVVRGTRNASYPAWAWNRKIVFVRGSNDGGNIYMVLPNGDRLRRLSKPGKGAEEHPQWSTNGRRIVFVRGAPYGNFDVFRTRSDGSGVTRLTRGCCDKADATWSPDGRKVLFVQDNDGSLLVMRAADGGGRREVAGGGRTPDWQPVKD
jgi:TolB protein